MVSIIFMVIGLIMLGVATPSEAAAYGCVGVIILAGYYLLAIIFQRRCRVHPRQPERG